MSGEQPTWVVVDENRVVRKTTTVQVEAKGLALVKGWTAIRLEPGQQVAVAVCDTCRTKLHYGKCPACEAS